ncbi:MAG: patatin-like phospholipase family protein [Bacteroidetes bacterium]|nr:patatin-like phospholipase family protein [Bacteroidota bacterium]
MNKEIINILSLDGGGSKGVYTLGVLSELEKAFGCKIYKKFDLIYGTSTGSIIASLLALGLGVDEIKKHYFEIIPSIMTCSRSSNKSKTLEAFAEKIYKDKGFSDFKTNVGIVAMNYETQKPLIFKTTSKMAHGVKNSFEPAFWFGNKGCCDCLFLPHQFSKRKYSIQIIRYTSCYRRWVYCKQPNLVCNY